MKNDLHEEIRAYEHERDELLKDHAGEYVVYVGATRLGIYETEQEAARSAIVDHRHGRFLMRRIERSDPVFCVPSLAWVQ